MNYLFIDGSENNTFAQAGNAKDFSQQTFATRRNLGAKICEISEQVLALAKLEAKDIDLFAVCTGPGSLTGLRVANSFMRTLAFLRQKPLLGVDLFTWSAMTLKNSGQRGKVFLMAPTLIDKAFVLEVDLDQDFARFNARPELQQDRRPHESLPTFAIRWENDDIRRIEPEAKVLHQLITDKNESEFNFSRLLEVLPMYIIPSQAERKLENQQC